MLGTILSDVPIALSAVTLALLKSEQYIPAN
jgi:hypothetical protein